MDPVPSKSLETYLPYKLSEIPEFLRCRAKTELFEDEEARIHSLELLRSMLKGEPDLRWQDDDSFLLSFLRARKFDVKNAFHLMKNFYTQVYKHDEIILNLNFQDVKKTLEGNAIGYLPYRDSDGSAIIYLRTSHWNPSEDTLCDLMRALICAFLHANLCPASQIAGFKIILNCAGFSLKHVPHMSPSYLWLLSDGLTNCFPGRFRAIFIFNENSIISSFITIVIKCLTNKLKNRIYFCGKNVKKIHKHISPSILPADILGELPPYDNTEWRKSIEEKADYFAHVFSHGYTKNKGKSQENKSKET